MSTRSPLLEITATYIGEKFHFDNPDSIAIIGDATHVSGEKPDGVNCRMVVRGNVDSVDDLLSHQTYRFYGRWTEYLNKRTRENEPQFAFQTFVLSAPQSRAGIITYLSRHGEGLGIGKSRAATLYEKFAGDAVRVCRESPEVAAAAVSGWSISQAEEFAAELQASHYLEECSIELIELLDKRGFPKATAQSAIRLWGNRAKLVISNDPYKLMNFRGCGFKRCDRMWLDLGLPPDRLKRQALCAWYAVASNSFGHTWFPIEIPIEAIRQTIGRCNVTPDRAIELAVRADMLTTTVSESGKTFIAETRKANNERFISERIGECEREVWANTTPITIDDSANHWPDVSTIPSISDHQREQLALATSGMIGILGGSPGTGKTFASASLILALLQKFGPNQIAVAAPTGKAAVRITEAMTDYRVGIRATTIHSLLRVEQVQGGGWSFAYKLGRPLPVKFLIVDEMSMGDTDLTAAVLAARSKQTHVLLIGDIHQLPPVGHGAPLRDFIAAGMPVGELREIRRNSGAIVQVCAAIRDGAKLELSRDEMDLPAGKNLRLMLAQSPDNQILRMFEAIKWAVTSQKLDPIWDVQVIAAVNDKSPLSRKALNKLLQGELNGAAAAVPGSPFRVGDKVVNLKNGWSKPIDGESVPSAIPTNERGDVYVANGDVGKVVEVEAKSLVVELQIGKLLVRVPRGKASDGKVEGDEADGDLREDQEGTTGCSWDLAYCLSCHKAQGAEFPVAIVMLDEYPGALRVASKEWCYTAISRGKLATFLVGKESTVEAMRRKVALGLRKTFLRELIEGERTKALVESL